MSDPRRAASKRGSLVVVGTGVDVVTHLTPGARAAIASSDEVLYLVADSLSALRLTELNARARSLDGFYAPDKDRRQTYAEIVDEIVGAVLAGARVCTVLYGHPGMFACPGHEAIARVRQAGLSARMLPAISALDCLVADLGIDPGRTGIQSYDATDFLQRRPPVDLEAMLVLWQVGMIGERGGAASPAVAPRFELLLEVLRSLYGRSQRAILYEASPYPGGRPLVTHLRLGDGDHPAPSVLSTLCVSRR